MALTEQRVIKQIAILPLQNAINVQWANQVLRDGELLTETYERKSYTASQSIDFASEVGAFDIAGFVSDFTVDALNSAQTAAQDKATAEAALTTAQARIADLEAQIAAPAVNVQSVSPRQIRQALTANDMGQQVADAVAAGDQNLKDWWNYSTVFDRNNAQVVAMGAALGVSDASLDDLWALAASL